MNEETLLLHQDLDQMGLSVSNTTLLRWEKAGRFPRRLRLAGTRVAWLKSKVDEWLNQTAERRNSTHYAEY